MRLAVDLSWPFSHNVANVYNRRRIASGRSVSEKPGRSSPRSPGGVSTVLRWAERCIGLFVTLLLVLLVLIHIPWTQTRLLETLTGRIVSDMGLHVRSSGFWWAPFLGVHVRDLELEEAGRSVLSCPEAVVDFAFYPGRPWLVLESILLKSPTLHLKRINGRFVIFENRSREQGRRGGGGSPRPESANRPWPSGSQMLSVQVRSGRITADQNELRVLDIKGIDGSFTLRGDGEVRAPFLKLDSLGLRD